MKSRNAFTLVELLVVIAIIGILIGMLLPAVQQVREAARRTDCGNKIRQQGLALMNYESAHKVLPPGWTTDDPNDPLAEPGWGWSAHILPFMEANNVYELIDFDVAIDDHSHEVPIQAHLEVFLCPSDDAPDLFNLDEHVDHGGDHFVWHDTDGDEHGELLVGRSNYSGVFGSTEIEDSPLLGNGTFYANSETELRDFRDGQSNTIIVGERSNDLGPISWVGVVGEVDEPFARIVAVTDHSPNDDHGHFEDFRSSHPQGINVVLGDGSTHFVNENISEEVFQALGTKRGGEIASLED